jgi:hypothetical protein
MMAYVEVDLYNASGKDAQCCHDDGGLRAKLGQSQSRLLNLSAWAGSVETRSCSLAACI